MRVLLYARQFERDVKRQQRRSRDMAKLSSVIRTPAAEELLEARYRDHALAGNWKGRRECHIEPDWLLIYKIEGNRIIFERTGSHSDLFGRRE